MLWSILVLTLAMALCASLLPGFEVKGRFGVLKVAIVFGLVNWALGKLVFFVIGVGTLGLGFLLAFVTRLVVTALLLKLTDALMESLRIDRFRTALWAALIVSATGALLDWVLRLFG